jgi:hypothetical protein
MLDETLLTNKLAAFDAALDFPVHKERITRAGINDKFFVVNGKTDEALGIVGQSFLPTSHPDFFGSIRPVWQEKLPHLLDDVQINNKISSNGAWALEEVIFPRAKTTIETDKHSTDIALRFIYWHGLSGNCKSNCLVGAIDFFCTNGMVRGDYDHLKKKNTKNFSLDDFVDDIGGLEERFNAHVAWCKNIAAKRVSEEQIQMLLDDVIPFERTRVKMLDSVMEEVSTRGWNVWSVYSAFTQYASHEDRFGLKNTANNNIAERMFNRNTDVARWTSSPAFMAMAAAA